MNCSCCPVGMRGRAEGQVSRHLHQRRGPCPIRLDAGEVRRHNHKFYDHVFELILRLKGNYLWPAMWGRAIYDDDPESPKLADEYGIVIGTSHHEPMMRAHVEWERYGKGPWNYDANEAKLREFWTEGVRRMGDNESVVTVGMRGDGDEPMSETANIALLERIVADQREIIAEVTGKDPAEVPQMWALYKEVQEYYDHGMRVPDDVTLLLCDDNWGNIRKLPKLGEKPAVRRLRNLLPLRLRRRAAQLQMDQHQLDPANLGADAPGVRVRRRPAVDRQRRRHQADGVARPSSSSTMPGTRKRGRRIDCRSTHGCGRPSSLARNMRRRSRRFSTRTRGTTPGANRSCSRPTRTA